MIKKTNKACPGSFLNRDLIPHQLKDPAKYVIPGEDGGDVEFNPYSFAATIIPLNTYTGNDYDIYAPDWYLTLAVFDKDLQVTNDEHKKRNWITSGLLSESEFLYPTCRNQYK